MIDTIKHIPICIIGAGGIVEEAHLPAYQIAGFAVKGIVDIKKEKASLLAAKFGVATVYDTLHQMVAANGNGVVYDCALPASEILDVLDALPDNACVLIQKPLGESLEEAKVLVEKVKQKGITAGVNFQLRFAPYIVEAKKLIANGAIGFVTDLEVYVNVHTPWHLWDFLFVKARMEINYHSIHYIDLIRSFLGTPQKIYARTFKHPQSIQLASVKSNIIMDFGDLVRAVIHTNHNHNFGCQNQQSYIKIEGTNGAIKINFGALIDYPKGVPDSFEYIILAEDQAPVWQKKPIEGSWFPHAFIGTMEQMLLTKSGLISRPENSIEDAYETMRCVEAAYISSQSGGVQMLSV